MWDAASGQPLLTLTGHDGPGAGGGVSPGRDQAGQRQPRQDGAGVGRGQRRQLLATLHGHTDAVSGGGVSARTASGWPARGCDRTVRVWDAASGRQRWHPARAHGLVSGGGVRARTDAAGERRCDRTVRVWDAASGAALATLSGHDGGVWAVACRPDGTRLASAGDDRTVRVWDAASGRQLAHPAGPRRTVSGGGVSARMAPGWPAPASDRTVRLWDAASGQQLLVLPGHRTASGRSRSRPTAPGWRAPNDGTVRLRDVNRRGDPIILRGHEGGVLSVAFSPRRHQAGERILGPDGAGFWDAASGRQLLVLPGHESGVTGRVLARRHQAGERILGPDGAGWDATTSKQLHVLRGHGGAVRIVSSHETAPRWRAHRMTGLCGSGM